MEKHETDDRKRDRLLIGGMVLAALLILFGTYQIYLTITQYDRAGEEYDRVREMAVVDEDDAQGDSYTFAWDRDNEDTFTVPRPDIQVDLEALKEKNPDTVGWVYYPPAGINYPVMQDSNNNYYIRHTFEKERNANGSIFLDCHASPDFKDMHTIIYGHNMRNSVMFGNLKNIREEGALKANPYFWVFTEEGVNAYQIFSYHYADVEDDSFHTIFVQEEEYAGYLDYILGKSEVDTGIVPTTGQKVVTLATCADDSSIRLLVHGVLVR